jgi:hypothetical protein
MKDENGLNPTDKLALLQLANQNLGGAPLAMEIAAEKSGLEVAKRRHTTILSKPPVRKAVMSAIEDMGVTEVYLAQTLKDGLRATKLCGKDEIEHPDFAIRHKYLETVLKLREDLREGSTGGKESSGQVNVQFNVGDNMGKYDR